VTTGDRARSAAARLETSARQAGVGEQPLTVLRNAVELALGRRAQRFPDPHHGDFLHPVRNALILLSDAGTADPHALTAAVLLDTEDIACSIAPDAARALAGAEVADILAEVPAPAAAGERLLELLVTARPLSQLVALAERLDHVRHLHLRPTEQWPGAHADVLRVYLPLADRVHETLARRFRWWADAFARRYL
jgi:(p)ppGpp synthase/HD superfamily hydrolase